MNGIHRRPLKGGSGQAIAEGTAFLVIFCAIFVACLLLYLNTVVLSDYVRKLETAAFAAAKAYDTERLFCGVVRPDFNPSTAQQRAQTVAIAVLNTLGIKTSEIVTPVVCGPVQSNGVTLTRATVEINTLHIIGQAPLKWHLKASSVDYAEGGGPYCVAAIRVHTPGGNPALCRQIAFPAYYAISGIGGFSQFNYVFPPPSFNGPFYNPCIDFTITNSGVETYYDSNATPTHPSGARGTFPDKGGGASVYW